MSAAVYLCAGVFIAVSAAFLSDAMLMNATYGAVLALFGGVLGVLGLKYGRESARWRVVIAIFVLVVGLVVVAGSLFRVFIEGYATFG